MALLRVIAGEHEGKVYALDSDKLTLGRESNEIPVLDHGVSRQHAEFFRIGELYLVRDLGSRNGTFVNGDKVDEWVLRAGDRVQVGNTRLVFEDKFTGQTDSRVIRLAETAEKPGQTMSIPLPKSDVVDPGEEHSRLKVFHRISKVLGTGENLDETMQKVARVLGKVLRADHIYVFSFEEPDDDPDSDEDIRFVAGFDRQTEEEVAVSRTVLERVRNEGLPILSSDAMLDERFSASDSVVVQQIKSLLCVPLLVMNQPIGALYATNSKLSEQFSPEDLEMFTQVGMLVGNSLEMWKRVERQGRIYRSVLKMLAAVAESHQPDRERGSSERIATYAAGIASALDDPHVTAQDAWIAGLLHDLGAIDLSREELEKSINAEQRKQRKAAELLERLPDLRRVAPAIERHTERLDGSGFPDGLSGEDQIPLLAQIVGVACEFDRLLTSGADDGGELPTKTALERVEALSPKKFSERVTKAVLIAYRLNQLFDPANSFRGSL